MAVQTKSDQAMSEFIRNSNVQASLILALGSFSWKLLSVLSNIEFLMAIKEKRAVMIFQFLQTTGWWIICILGLAYLAYLYLRGVKSEQQRPNWLMVISCSIIALLFGVLLGVESSGGVPKVITSWGSSDGACRAGIDASKLLTYKDEFKVGLACGVENPTTDRLEDDRVTISKPFEIIKGEVYIVAPYRPSTVSKPTDRWWFYAILIPKDVSTDKIITLSDLQKYGGKIVNPQYFFE